jgi:hypothetical protein
LWLKHWIRIVQRAFTALRRLMKMIHRRTN